MRFAPTILIALPDGPDAERLAVAMVTAFPDSRVAVGTDSELVPGADVILAPPEARPTLDRALSELTGPPPSLIAIVSPNEPGFRAIEEFDDVLWTDDDPTTLARRVRLHARRVHETHAVRQEGLAFADHVRALYEAAPGPWLPIEERISRLLAVARRVIGSDVAAVLGIPEGRADGTRVVYAASSDASPPPDDSIPLVHKVWEEAIAVQRETGASDIIDTPFIASHHTKPEWFLGVPIWVEERPYGLLAFSGRRGRTQDSFLSPDRDFVRVLGRWIGTLLERVRGERERIRLEDRFRDAQKLETLGVVVGGIAHDFNNLLMTILANSKLARMDLPDESSALQSLAQLEVAARRAAELTEQMLAYAGKGRIEVSRIAPSRLVSEMGPLLSTVIGKRAELELELDETLEEIDADGGQLRQLLINLVTNASDALAGQAGSIRVRTGLTSYLDGPPDGAFVAPEAPSGSYVFLEVADEGCGVAENTLGKMFDPFFSTKVDGRGLGLAAVLGIVRAHHGAIQVQSRLRSGTQMRILLPTSVRTAVEEAPSIPLVTDQPGVTVLVADDEEQLRTTLERLLVQFDFRVLTAADGLEAVQAVRDHAAELDVVLLDLTMPELGGAEALSAIRKIDAALPIMFMSGYHGHMDEAVAQSDPLTSFMHKPFDPLALIHRLGEMARLREKTSTE